jgi:hypothetical protein
MRRRICVLNVSRIRSFAAWVNRGIVCLRQATLCAKPGHNSSRHHRSHESYPLSSAPLVVEQIDMLKWDALGLINPSP